MEDLTGANGTMPRLLLVEDDPVSQAFLTEALRALPAEVHVAESMATALAMGLEHDLWLLDAYLPDGNAQMLLARLREHFPETPALAHTASTSPALHHELLEAGFDGVVVKPVSVNKLHAEVRRLLPGLAEPTRATAFGNANRSVWNDDAALAALNGQQNHVTALRQLFLSELPQQHDGVMSALHRGDLAEARKILHQLKASCGFVGATRLKTAVETLDRTPADADAISTFVQAIHDTRSTA